MPLDSENINETLTTKKEKTNSNINISLKLKKLNLAKKTAFTKGKKNKILNNAEDLSQEVDKKIKSIALNKFIIRKTKRLKSLGETKEKINSLILDLSISEDNRADKIRTTLKGIGIDKKFVGLSADAILKKVNAIPKKPEEERNEEEPVENIDKNNEKIYDHFVKIGDLDTANYILDLMSSPIKSTQKVSDVSANTNELKKLSHINSGIYQKLDEIEKNMIDEQDTSISIPQKLQEQKERETTETSESIEKEEKTGGFLSSILGTIFGTGIMSLLMGKGGVKGFIFRLFKKGGIWIYQKVKGIFKKLLEKSLEGINTSIKFLHEKFLWISEKMKTVWKFIKKFGGDLGEKASKELKKFTGLAKETGKKIAGSKIGKSVLSISDNVSGFFSGMSEKLSKNTAQIVEKGLGKTGKTTKLSEGIIHKAAGKGALGLGKGALGLIAKGLSIAALPAFATYDAQNGYKNADKILGKDKKDLTPDDKANAAAGSVISGLTFGAVSPWDGVRFFKKLGVGIMGASKHVEAVRNVESSGIIKDNKVLDWEKMKTLSEFDLKALLIYKNFNKEDKKRISEIIKSKILSPTPKKAPNNVDVASTQNNKIQTKIDSINYNIVELKKLQQDHINNGEIEKSESIERYINQNTETIKELNLSLDNSQKAVVSKDKKIQQTEQMYNDSLKNTKSYDSKNTIQQQSTNINSINTTKQTEEAPSFFKIFDF